MLGGQGREDGGPCTPGLLQGRGGGERGLEWIQGTVGGKVPPPPPFLFLFSFFAKKGGRGALAAFWGRRAGSTAPVQPCPPPPGVHFLLLTAGAIKAPSLEICHGVRPGAEQESGGRSARANWSARIPGKTPRRLPQPRGAGSPPSAATPQPSGRAVLPRSGRQVAAASNPGFPGSEGTRGWDRGPGTRDPGLSLPRSLPGELADGRGAVPSRR